jgi:hypothetical protein
VHVVKRRALDRARLFRRGLGFSSAGHLSLRGRHAGNMPGREGRF